MTEINPICVYCQEEITHGFVNHGGDLMHEECFVAFRREIEEQLGDDIEFSFQDIMDEDPIRERMRRMYEALDHGE